MSIRTKTEAAETVIDLTGTSNFIGPLLPSPAAATVAPTCLASVFPGHHCGRPVSDGQELCNSHSAMGWSAAVPVGAHPSVH
ncbi:MAG: hypothetical protein QOG03_265 [Actinomycetota bacterium]|jgi:hypothetical protein|nr:hypothetical protein [Actinomycetota bacterium]